jgi:hypothetical protein
MTRRNEYEAVMSLAQKREARAVKKWSLESLKVRGQHNYALDIHEKYSRRLFRRQFLQWQKRSKFQKEPGMFESSKSMRASRTTQAGSRSFEPSILRRTYGGTDLSKIPEAPLSPNVQTVAHDFASTVPLKFERSNPQLFEFHYRENVQEADSTGVVSTVLEIDPQDLSSRSERTPIRNTSKTVLRTQPRIRPIGMSQSTSDFPATKNRRDSTHDEDNDDDEVKTDTVEHWVQEVEDPMDFQMTSGFLNTPSKRAVPNMNSTTPAAHLATPIERRLRAQYSGGLLQSFQRGRFDATGNKDTPQEAIKYNAK